MSTQRETEQQVCGFEWSVRRYYLTNHKCKLPKRHRGPHKCLRKAMDTDAPACRASKEKAVAEEARK